MRVGMFVIGVCGRSSLWHFKDYAITAGLEKKKNLVISFFSPVFFFFLRFFVRTRCICPTEYTLFESTLFPCHLSEITLNQNGTGVELTTVVSGVIVLCSLYHWWVPKSHQFLRLNVTCLLIDVKLTHFVLSLSSPYPSHPQFPFNLAEADEQKQELWSGVITCCACSTSCVSVGLEKWVKLSLWYMEDVFNWEECEVNMMKHLKY